MFMTQHRITNLNIDWGLWSWHPMWPPDASLSQWKNIDLLQNICIPNARRHTLGKIPG